MVLEEIQLLGTSNNRITGGKGSDTIDGASGLIWRFMMQTLLMLV